MTAWYILFFLLFVLGVISYFVVDGWEHPRVKLFSILLFGVSGLAFFCAIVDPVYAESERNEVSSYILSILNDGDKDVYRCVGVLESGISFDVELHDLFFSCDDNAVLVKYADSGFLSDKLNRGTPYYDLILPADSGGEQNDN
ncbi:hypothetical protein [Marasmitruncus massiliensis]|uniref:hypothetical protein n=1 Tax=Marasmitruncus massiliensis TaxID=1944642 RepID=UPI000C7C87F0|nr:hypothetical protein [Marasmitruncus massiliensis]